MGNTSTSLQTPSGYIVSNDCPVNYMTGSLPNNKITPFFTESLQSCTNACSHIKTCAGVSYSGNTCYLKNNICPPKATIIKSSQFYKRVDTTQKKPPDTILNQFSLQNGDCAGNGIISVVDALPNCLAACNSLSTCQGVSWNEKTTTCILQKTTCAKPDSASAYKFYSKSCGTCPVNSINTNNLTQSNAPSPTPASPTLASPTSPTSPTLPAPASPTPASPTPALPTPALPTLALPTPASPTSPAPASPTSALPTPASPTPALPTPASPTPALPTSPAPASPTQASPTPVSPTSSAAPTLPSSNAINSAKDDKNDNAKNTENDDSENTQEETQEE